MVQKIPTNFYVYQLRRADRREPFYVGKGKGRRIHTHFQLKNLLTHSHKNHTIIKANTEGVPILREILFEGLTHEESLRVEVWHIKMWGRSDLGEGPLTNLSDGGDGNIGHIDSKESRLKKSLAHKGKLKSPETIEKVRQIHIGLKRNADTCERIRNKAIGRIRSAESKEKQSRTIIGRTRAEFTEEHKANIAKSAENRKRIPCTKCGKSCTPSTVNRWHNDNCKIRESP